MDEFQLIEYLTKRFHNKDKEIIKSIGDDTAVIQPLLNRKILFTTDSLVEQIHFQFDYNINKKRLWQSLGWKSLAVNISDIFAMGGEPAYALISLHVPASIKPKLMNYFYQGLSQCAKQYNVTIIGGNTAEIKQYCVFTVSLIGYQKNSSLLRSQAQIDDYIYIQKGVGLSSAGLALLKKGEQKNKRLIMAHLKPEPKSINRILKKHTVHSAIDISDGLIQDLNHILKASKKGAILYPDIVSVDMDLKKSFPGNYMNFILYGGEDYKILFTSPDIIEDSACIRIGKIIKKRGILLYKQNKTVKLDKYKGYTHFN